MTSASILLMTTSPSRDDKMLAALEKKRLYNKNRNREFRRQEAEEKRRLSLQVLELEATIEHMNKARESLTGALTWREIATVFDAELSESKHQTEVLRQRIKRNESTRQALDKWLSTMGDASPMTLMAHESARHLAFDWISCRLYENVPAVLGHAPCYGNSVHLATVVDPVGASYQLTTRTERIETQSLSVTAKVLYAMHFQTHGAVQILDTPGHHMVYFSQPSTFGRLRGKPFQENVLVCQWAVDDYRYVVCSQSIVSDELHPSSDLQQSWTSWMIAERAGPHATRIVRCITMGGIRQGNALLPIGVEEPSLRCIEDATARWRGLVTAREAYAAQLAEEDIAVYRDTLAHLDTLP
ncbi:hypothetical protein ACHHYP_11118 [Achlya hypogyna]|uniref:BZIP domain-containing protein n=1 Tax=Achlya hypogyna TaxID=1202772 RepID=A0A1V9YJR8_ACHHY|nr:hypothetical protein ACHHYP_11118 [Achlya hypogyna]